jgi:Flp pilus assembly protein TadD
MNKTRKEAAKKKSIAQKAAARAKKIKTLNEAIIKPSPAVASEKKGIQEAPTQTEVLARANFALKNDDFEMAVTLLREAIRLDPLNPDTFVSLGIAYANLGQHDFALAASQMALQLNPEHAIAVKNRGLALSALGLPETTNLSA